ncbi:porin [Bergeriella denitrificans]|uniref:Porin n=1 Tax=Bergeriella denitrificans TaxID=494 RepID=A0A378UHF5_BERDE|nr:porin [Bergeriella denitrificans]STZ76804.1 porin [Bergeriella denitrificans]
MKRTLWLLAAACAAPALADVQFYGTLKSGVETAQTRFGGRSASHSGVSDFGSHIGLRGSHPIGGGARAVWQLEQDAPVGARSSSGSLREQWRAQRDSGESFIGIER